MDLLSKTQELCRSYDISPTKSKGQNFLVEEELYYRIIELANINKEDEILEVGPGLGFLTERLAKEAKRLLAVELDNTLYDVLSSRLVLENYNNVTVVNQDILDFKPEQYFTGPYKIVANLPYQISSVFLRKFLSESNHRPDEMLLLLQKEVVERICAPVGQRSLLSLSVLYYGEPEALDFVPKTAFWPEPRVDSSLIRIILKKDLPLDSVEEKLFWRLLKFAFSQKRKMLKNNVGNALKIGEAKVAELLISLNLNDKARAQELSLENWLKLFASLKSFMV